MLCIFSAFSGGNRRNFNEIETCRDGMVVAVEGAVGGEDRRVGLRAPVLTEDLGLEEQQNPRQAQALLCTMWSSGVLPSMQDFLCDLCWGVGSDSFRLSCGYFVWCIVSIPAKNEAERDIDDALDIELSNIVDVAAVLLMHGGGANRNTLRRMRLVEVQSEICDRIVSESLKLICHKMWT